MLENTAYLSSWLLLLITFGAMVGSWFYERRVWCRYLCPIGGMNGLYASRLGMATVEIVPCFRNTCLRTLIAPLASPTCVRDISRATAAPVRQVPKELPATVESRRSRFQQLGTRKWGKCTWQNTDSGSSFPAQYYVDRMNTVPALLIRWELHISLLAKTMPAHEASMQTCNISF